MTMYDIRHRVGIAAPATAVYDKLTSTAGLESWWAQTVTGDPTPGGKLTFYFGRLDASIVMEVVDSTPDTHVRWRCVDGPSEWIDTTFDFDLNATDSETIMLFTNVGWREPVEFMHHCSTKWGQYFLSLKASVETGEGRPHPRDEMISSWD